MDAAAQEYIDAIAPEHRPLFDRIHGLVLGLYPDAEVLLSYKMPTYMVGRNSLHVGVWKHGLSLYGWKDHEARFTSHHPELVGDKGPSNCGPKTSRGSPMTSYGTC